MIYDNTLGRPVDFMRLSASAQHVYFDRNYWVGCWADIPGDAVGIGCQDKEATGIGLCAKHYKEIVSG